MKLLDLLVQELPKTGGWPEGVANISQDHDKELYVVYEGKEEGAMYYGDLDELAEDHRRYGETRTSWVTKAQYLALEKWDDNAFPPVGCVCEYDFYDRSGSNWTEVEIVFSGKDFAVGLVEGKETVFTTPSHFRKQQTKKVYGKALKDLAELGINMEDAEKIYDAIQNGRISGVHMEV